MQISHVNKTFKADIGIDALNLLIEVKFIDNAVEMRSECPSLFEDMFAYRGDRKWKHFFALVYCTGPHLRQEELEAEFALAKCPPDWIPIAVYGKGGRPNAMPLKRRVHRLAEGALKKSKGAGTKKKAV